MAMNLGTDLDEVASGKRDVFPAQELFRVYRDGLATADDHDVRGIGSAEVTRSDNGFGEGHVVGPGDGGVLERADEGDDGFVVGVGHAGQRSLLAGDVGLALPGSGLRCTYATGEDREKQGKAKKDRRPWRRLEAGRRLLALASGSKAAEHSRTPRPGGVSKRLG